MLAKQLIKPATIAAANTKTIKVCATNIAKQIQNDRSRFLFNNSNDIIRLDDGLPALTDDPELFIPITDSDIVQYIHNDPTLQQDVIPFMYSEGILKRNNIVYGNRWGIDFVFQDKLEQDPELIAIHEAGHAIVIMDRGVKFRYIGFTEKDGFLGGVTEKINIKNIPVDEFTYYSDTDCFSRAGGPIAASKYLHGNPTTWDYGVLDDFICLCDLELRNSYGDVEYMVKVATDIVEKRWVVVEAIADHMLKLGRVPYAKCMRIADRIEGEKNYGSVEK